MNKKRTMKKKLMGAVMLTAALITQLAPVQLVWAAQVRAEETGALLGEALEELESGTYEEHEALVSFEATNTAALAQKGVYRYDAAVKVADVSAFDTDAQTGKTLYVVRLTSEKYTTEELMELALGQYYVDSVSANGYQEILSADPYADAQWYLDGTGTDSAGIRLSEQKIQPEDTPVIAVIDTGVDYTHPDLMDSMWVNPYPDQLDGTYGFDFGENDDDPMDKNGHGTHVSGIAAAAQDNGIGISGAAAAKIMALKVVPDANTNITDAAVISAYEYVYQALTLGVNVKAVNCSWGGSRDTNGMLSRVVNAVGEAGALSVFAAGNDSVNWDQVRGARATPYDLDSDYTLIVGASNESDEAAYYSDYGADSVDLFAPGSNILSTYLTPMYLPGVYDDETRRELSLYYNQFSESQSNLLPAGQTWETFYTAADIGLATDYTVDVQKVKNGANGYLKLTVTRWRYSRDGEAAGSIYVDVTDLNLDQNAAYYVGFLDGDGSGSEVCWQAQMMTSTAENSRFVTINGKTYMRIVGLDIARQSLGRPMTWYLDEIAISAPNVAQEMFGCYTYQEGTSMAAPVVSAAVAVLGGANPTLSAATLRTQLLKSVRKVDALTTKCVAGGIIDFSKLKQLVSEVKLNKTTVTRSYKKTLTLKATVTPTDAENQNVKWKTSNSAYATVSQNGVVRLKKAGIGHTVKIKAVAKDGSKKYAVCKIKIKK